MELHNTFADALGKPRIVGAVSWGVRRHGTPTFTTVSSVEDAITLLRSMDNELTISDLSCWYNTDGEVVLQVFQGAHEPYRYWSNLAQQGYTTPLDYEDFRSSPSRA